LKRHWKAYCVSLFLSCFVVILASCQSDSEETGTPTTAINVGDLIPDFTLAGTNGDSFSSTSLKGQVYILNFFDTGCPDCQKELQVLQQIYEKYEEMVPLLNVPRSQTRDEIQSYWEKTNLTLPYYIPNDKNLYYKFASRTIPRTYVVDSKGIVHAAFTDSPMADYDTLDGLLEKLLEEAPDNKDKVRLSMKLRLPRATRASESLLNNEFIITKLEVWFFEADTKEFSKKAVIESFEKAEISTDTYYDVTYTFKDLRIPVGVYDIFTIANYYDSPDSVENESELLNWIDCKTYKIGMGANIPDEGPVMTNSATSLLGIDLVPYKNHYYELTTDLERVMAKLQIGVKKNSFSLRHEERPYATVNITNYKLVNLNTCYYLFQHVDNLPEFTERTSFVIPENFREYTDEGQNYVVDPLFYDKKPNSLDIALCAMRYESWYGDYNTDNFASMPSADNYGIVYILENTSFKTSQKNGYSPGIVFKAAVSPLSVYLYDSRTGDLNEEFRPEYWPDEIYLYDFNFYGSIKAINMASGLTLDELGRYTDAQLKTYGIKKCVFNMGVYETYYTYWIQHRQSSSDMGPMKYGIIRNNYYKLCVEDVTGIGYSAITPDIMRDNYPNSFTDVKVSVTP
jgi:peroxiredoxin